MPLMSMAHSCRKFLLLSAALLALASTGCLAAAVGCVAGGAYVAGRAYHNGKVCQTYLADLPDALAATKAALTELGLVVEKEQSSPDCVTLRTRTGDGDRIRVELHRQMSRLPAEGPITDVCIRVATFGDRPLSDRILYQISAHLAPPSTPQPPALAPVSPPPTLAPPKPMEPPVAK